MTDALLPLIVALSGLPAAGIAAWLARTPDPAGPGLALRMALVALAILLGSLGLYWAAADERRLWAVVVAMVVVVNLLALSMWRHLRRVREGRSSA